MNTIQQHDDPSAQELETFVTFIKRHVNIIVAFAATPILTGFFDLIPPPNIGSAATTKLFPTAAAVLCGFILIALFFARFSLGNKSPARWLVGGIVAAVVGIVLLVWYAIRISGPLPAGVNGPLPATIPEIALYLMGFPIACGGIVAVFLYGFVTRSTAFAQLTATLEDVHLQHLETIARSFQLTNEDNDELHLAVKVRNAFKKSSWEVIKEASNRMSNLANGWIEIWGQDMDTVHGNFIEAIEKNFRALSRDDLDYWASNDCKLYLEYNKKLVDRKLTVERVFLIRLDKGLEERHEKALKNQINMGIKIRVASLADLKNLDEKELDFGLFDDFAVSFWRFNHGRLFRVTVDKDEFKKHQKTYDRVKAHCMEVPGKDKQNGDITLIESIEELDRLLTTLKSLEKSAASPDAVFR